MTTFPDRLLCEHMVATVKDTGTYLEVRELTEDEKKEHLQGGYPYSVGVMRCNLIKSHPTCYFGDNCPDGIKRRRSNPAI